MTSELLELDEITETSQAKPVFLLCPPSSGGNLLAGLLHAHPGLYVTPGLAQMLAWPTLAEYFRHCQDSAGHAHGLLRTVAQLYTGEQSVASIETARRWIGRRRQQPVMEVFEEIYQKIAPARMVDRHLTGLKDDQTLEMIQDLLPDASFIHLVRHPVTQGMAVMHSLEGIAGLYDQRSIDYAGKRPEIDPQYAWFNSNAAIMEFAETVPSERYFIFRLEEFLADPQATLGRLFPWLGVDFSEADYQAMLHGPSWPFCRPGPFNAAGASEYDALQIQDGKLPDVEPHTLDEALPWRSQTAGFAEPVKLLARELGY